MSAKSTVTSRSLPSSSAGSRSSAAARSGVKNCSNWTRLPCRLRLAFKPRQPGSHGRRQDLGQLGLERPNLE